MQTVTGEFFYFCISADWITPSEKVFIMLLNVPLSFRVHRVLSCSILSTVLLSVQINLSVANFVFQYELLSVNTRGPCTGLELTPACETYLSSFCLRPQTEAGGCSLGSSGRYGPDFNFPMTRRISSTSPWPVSLFIIKLKCLLCNYIRGCFVWLKEPAAAWACWRA